MKRLYELFCKPDPSPNEMFAVFGIGFLAGCFASGIVILIYIWGV